MTRRGYAHCRNVETIPDDMGGGHLCTGPCGHPHLHGRAWSWWQCGICRDVPRAMAAWARLRTTVGLAAAKARRDALWYAPLDQVTDRTLQRRKAKGHT